MSINADPFGSGYLQRYRTDMPPPPAKCFLLDRYAAGERKFAGIEFADLVYDFSLAWLPRGVTMPQWDRGNGHRCAFWQHGMTNTEKAKAGVGYLMKYLSKLGEFHRFPRGMRLYGIGELF